ncbi:hypothetical protein KR026_000277 [Drosophila bipectinata]|nr:hypothetical protein KR026_000277 [Drosophila bipectinata]
MEAALVNIVNGLLSSNTNKIRTATAALAQAMENPEVMLGFCNIVVSPMLTDIRQYAAVILNKRLSKPRHWQLLGQDMQDQIKHMMLKALIAEEEKIVRSGIGQVVGTLVRHEANKTDSWVSELFDFVLQKCAVQDPRESELGSSILCTLADTAPDQFIHLVDKVCHMFSKVMVEATNQGNLVTITVTNLISCMSHLMHIIKGNEDAEKTLAALMPHIYNTVIAYARWQDIQEFQAVVEILESVSDHIPMLMSDVKPVLECCLVVASSKDLEDAIRCEAITCVLGIALYQKETVIKEELLEPVLNITLEVMCCSTGDDDEVYFDRMFYALDTFIRHLKDEVKPHLALLMERLSKALLGQTTPRICKLALSTIASVAAAAKMDFLPYFPMVHNVISRYILLEIPENYRQIRLESMKLLAVMARVVGRENFMPLANETMLFCLSILEYKADDKDLRRHAYILMGALSSVANEEMGAVFPKIMNCILKSVHPRTKDDEEMRESFEPDDSQAEDDDLVEKEQAIVALREFAANTGTAFAPYLQTSFDCVLKVVDSPYDTIRKAALETLSQFVIALYRIGDAEGVARASLVVVPMLAQVARDDQEQSVIIAALAALGELFKKVKGGVVPTIELRGIICELIKDLMTIKAACPDGDGNGDEDNEDVEGENVVMEHVARLLPLLGLALEPKEFSVYFASLHLQYVEHIPRDPSATDYCYIVYGALADCLQSLGTWIVEYFDHLSSLFIQGTAHPEGNIRKKAYYGLGELVLHSERRSFASYPIILQALSNAIATERDPAALDHIIGALARLLITHMEGVPLGEVLPAFMSYLPLRVETRENVSVQKAFRVLFAKARPAVEPYLEQMLVITVQTVLRKELPDSHSTEDSVNFIREIVHHYPPFFQKLSSSEECANLMHLL